jgi:hypothetical protein
MSTFRLATCPCQNCNGHIEFNAITLSKDNNKIACPHCGLETILFVPPLPDAKMQTLLSPPPPKTLKPEAKVAPKPVVEAEATADNMRGAGAPGKLKTESQRIRGVAGTFEVVARVLAALGCVCIFAFVICLSSHVGGKESVSQAVRGYAVGAGATFGSAMLIYLIAQVLHIRAALEK